IESARRRVAGELPHLRCVPPGREGTLTTAHRIEHRCGPADRDVGLRRRQGHLRRRPVARRTDSDRIDRQIGRGKERQRAAMKVLLDTMGSAAQWSALLPYGQTASVEIAIAADTTEFQLTDDRTSIRFTVSNAAAGHRIRHTLAAAQDLSNLSEIHFWI